MRITKLDGLRGVFCMMVVLYHCDTQGYLPRMLDGFFVIEQSYIFVDFFFVLSGFVISYNYNDFTKNEEFYTFLKKRFIRLFPLLFFTVTVFFTLSLISNYFLTAFTKDFETLGNLTLQYLDSILFLNSTPILGSTYGINYPSWSISSEMISYIIYGGSILVVSKKGHIYFSSLVILVSAVFLVYHGDFFAMGDYGFVRGIIGFLVGNLVYKSSKILPKINANIEYILCGALLVVIFLLDTLKGNTFFELIIPFCFGISIFILLRTEGWISKLLDMQIFQYLGKLSYSIYLNHAVIILVFYRLLDYFVPLESIPEIAQILLLICVLVVIVLYSNLTYVFIELKGSTFLKKILK
jgi:peptidoglycan/LPS O-acetylase OafA/YrhL